MEIQPTHLMRSVKVRFWSIPSVALAVNNIHLP